MLLYESAHLDISGPCRGRSTRGGPGCRGWRGPGGRSARARGWSARRSCRSRSAGRHPRSASTGAQPFRLSQWRWENIVKITFIKRNFVKNNNF